MKQRAGIKSSYITQQLSFLASKWDHEFLLNQKDNASNVSSNLNNFRQLNIAENSSNLIQLVPSNPGDTSDLTYHAWKRDADADYLSRWNSIKKLC